MTKPTFEQVAKRINALPIHRKMKEASAWYGDYDPDSFAFNMQCVAEDYDTTGWTTEQWIDAVVKEYSLNLEAGHQTVEVRDGIAEINIGGKTLFAPVLPPYKGKVQ